MSATVTLVDPVVTFQAAGAWIPCAVQAPHRAVDELRIVGDRVGVEVLDGFDIAQAGDTGELPRHRAQGRAVTRRLEHTRQAGRLEPRAPWAATSTARSGNDADFSSISSGAAGMVLSSVRGSSASIAI